MSLQKGVFRNMKVVNNHFYKEANGFHRFENHESYIIDKNLE